MWDKARALRIKPAPTVSASHVATGLILTAILPVQLPALAPGLAVRMAPAPAPEPLTQLLV